MYDISRKKEVSCCDIQLPIGVGSTGAAGAAAPPTTELGGRRYLFAPPQLLALEYLDICAISYSYLNNMWSN